MYLSHALRNRMCLDAYLQHETILSRILPCIHPLCRFPKNNQICWVPRLKVFRQKIQMFRIRGFRQTSKCIGFLGFPTNIQNIECRGFPTNIQMFRVSRFPVKHPIFSDFEISRKISKWFRFRQLPDKHPNLLGFGVLNYDVTDKVSYNSVEGK